MASSDTVQQDRASTPKPPYRRRAPPNRFDVILPMQDPFMDQIVTGLKTHEFRKYHICDEVRRIWFYRAAPHSSIEYFCEIMPAQTRNLGDPPLEGDGIGNKEYNEHHPGWLGYDFAYKIESVWKLRKPVKLQILRDRYGFNIAPRSMIYVPPSMAADVPWQEQEKVR